MYILIIIFYIKCYLNNSNTNGIVMTRTYSIQDMYIYRVQSRFTDGIVFYGFFSLLWCLV